MNKKTRALIGMIGSLLLCLVGIYRLIELPPAAYISFITVVFVVSGAIGAIANFMVLRKLN
ncbi:hypothetical protein SM124_06435 [Bacillus sp. 31A1R]|uniref:Uncharacterized protein n=1 Tax=Robertmurraya mangrovi TaxID=3098077 RepID=A0ABU5IW73_9BACI|nr:hypothetical protein [Bacillus sp. 31A1R]MDZ5471381.1 hypothetical protein [Bacillus sp. 31A1R]